MANTAKDEFRKLVESQQKTRALSRKWRNRKPEKADFDLTYVGINDLCRSKEKFEQNREKRASEILRNTPDPKAKLQVPFGWEGWLMVIISVVVFFCYYKLHIMTKLFGIIISVLCVLAVVFYCLKFARIKSKHKKKIAEMKEERQRVLHEEFKEMDTYNRILEYAQAEADYEQWQEIRKASHWKDIHSDDAREEIFSLYDMAGAEPDGTYDEFIDFIAELEVDGGGGASGAGDLGAREKTAVACPGGKRVVPKLVEGFIREMKEEGIKSGRIYATGVVDPGAKALCGDSVELCGLDDIMELVKFVDHE